MNYKIHYLKLIDTRKLLNRNKKEGFYEKHHIIPKCIGGSNDKDNLILLTPKEHYVAHLLLTQMYSGKIKSKLCYALLMMCRNNQNQHRIISARKYQFVKMLVSEGCSGENASFYGRELSEYAKKLLSERMSGDNNPSRKYGAWNKGLKLPSLSEETKNKIRLSNIGKKCSEYTKEIVSQTMKGKPKSEEHRKKLSDANKGKKLSPEQCEKMSLDRKGKKQKILVCPHCNKKGGTTMYRWHFDKCKFKEL